MYWQKGGREYNGRYIEFVKLSESLFGFFTDIVYYKISVRNWNFFKNYTTLFIFYIIDFAFQ